MQTFMINAAVLKLFADVSMFRRNGNTNGSVCLSVCRQSGINFFISDNIGIYSKEHQVYCLRKYNNSGHISA